MLFGVDFSVPRRRLNYAEPIRNSGLFRFLEMAIEMADFAVLRQTMVNTQLRTNKVTDTQVLAAMADIPREIFVPLDRATLAYIDEDILIGKSRCMVEPMILARMIQATKIGPEDVVLDVACGAGYSSAVLGRIARAVVAVESDAILAEAASARITKLGLDNVVVEIGSIKAGWSDQGPYDVIMVNGGCGEISGALFAQLGERGRLCAIMRAEAGTGVATLFVKTGGTISSRVLFDASVPALPEFDHEERFSF